MTTRRLRDPEREKRYAMRERPDSWLDNQKAVRRTQPLLRASIQRSYRRRVRVDVRLGDDGGAVRRERFDPLCKDTREEHLSRQRERRAALQRTPRKSEAARRRRAERRRG